MPSKVEIGNRALRMVGPGTITSFNQGTKPANVLSDIYDEVLKGLLASGKWKFASIRVQLARSTTAPALEFDNFYVLPSDWIRTIAIFNNDRVPGNTMYKMGQVGSQLGILSDEEELFLEYVKFEEDANLMTPLFRESLEIALAREMAIPIANSNTLEDQLAKKARRSLGRAMAVDAMGSFPVNRPAGTWVTSRFRSGVGGSWWPS